ncbi:Hypothetical predicted protein [Olea europaea subsp. europaea]|uniref:Uncharacterized protein n=1 Tax=Olea europaea subsp. europaea TaxID=158383 RepID=A0A8S0PI65_OLEEU|nr:Hypothetical predicted protein [Olea europaea subsp. europaea]
MPASLSVIECHQDEVWELPPNVEIMARSHKTRIEMFNYGDYIMGIQGHPEYTKDILLNIIDRLLNRNLIELFNSLIYLHGRRTNNDVKQQSSGVTRPLNDTDSEQAAGYLSTAQEPDDDRAATVGDGRGNDIYMCRPLVLRLMQRKRNADGTDEWGEFLHLLGKKFFDFNKIRWEIQVILWIWL